MSIPGYMPGMQTKSTRLIQAFFFFLAHLLSAGAYGQAGSGAVVRRERLAGGEALVLQDPNGRFHLEARFASADAVPWAVIPGLEPVKGESFHRLMSDLPALVPGTEPRAVLVRDGQLSFLYSLGEEGRRAPARVVADTVEGGGASHIRVFLITAQSRIMLDLSPDGRRVALRRVCEEKPEEKGRADDYLAAKGRLSSHEQDQLERSLNIAIRKDWAAEPDGMLRRGEAISDAARAWKAEKLYGGMRFPAGMVVALNGGAGNEAVGF